jgi:hypothetical protein
METSHMKTPNFQQDTDDTTKSPSVMKKIEGKEAVSSEGLKILSSFDQKSDVESQKVITPNFDVSNVTSPSKRSSDDIIDSPSIGKNKAMKQEGIKQFTRKLNLLENQNSPIKKYATSPLSTKISTTIADLSVNQNNLNITLKLHHKFEQSPKGRVGKFLGYDQCGKSVNVVFYEKTMKLFNELMEGQYIKIAYGKVKKSKKEYSLASSGYDIEMTDVDNVTIMENCNYSIPFEPKTIKEIIAQDDIGGVYDCYGEISSNPDSVVDEATRFSFTIEDETADIMIIAFDENSKDTLKAAFGMDQKIFVFQRLKFSTFQDKPQLIYRDGAEVLTHVKHEQFESFLKKNIMDI